MRYECNDACCSEFMGGFVLVGIFFPRSVLHTVSFFWLKNGNTWTVPLKTQPLKFENFCVKRVGKQFISFHFKESEKYLHTSKIIRTDFSLDAVIPFPSLISAALWSRVVWSSPFFLLKLFLFSVLRCVLKRLRDSDMILPCRKPSCIPRFIKNCFPHMWLLICLIGDSFLSSWMNISGRYLLQWLNFAFQTTLLSSGL